MTNPPRLFLLGDSISIDYGPYLERMLAGRFCCDRKGSELLEDENPASQDILQRLAEWDKGLPAMNGGDSSAVLAYLLNRVSHPTPDWSVLLLNCGLHDIRVDPQTGVHQVEPEDYARNLEEIVCLAFDLCRQVIWVRITLVANDRHQRLNPDFQRFNVDVTAYNDIADVRMKAAGVPSIDLYNFTLGLCDSLKGLEDLYIDHVHFTEQIRQLQAAYIAGWLGANQYE